MSSDLLLNSYRWALTHTKHTHTHTPTHAYYTCVLNLKQNNILTHTHSQTPLNRFIFCFNCYQIALVEKKSFWNHNKIILHALTLNNLYTFVYVSHTHTRTRRHCVFVYSSRASVNSMQTMIKYWKRWKQNISKTNILDCLSLCLSFVRLNRRNIDDDETTVWRLTAKRQQQQQQQQLKQLQQLQQLKQQQQKQRQLQQANHFATIRRKPHFKRQTNV